MFKITLLSQRMCKFEEYACNTSNAWWQYYHRSVAFWERDHAKKNEMDIYNRSHCWIYGYRYMYYDTMITREWHTWPFQSIWCLKKIPFLVSVSADQCLYALWQAQVCLSGVCESRSCGRCATHSKCCRTEWSDCCTQYMYQVSEAERTTPLVNR